MHICFLTHEYPKKGHTQGGIGSVVQTIAKALIKKGHKVSVVGVGRYKDEVENDGGVSVYRLEASNWKVANFIPNTKKLLKKLEEIHQQTPIDIVESSELNFAFFPKNYFAKKVIRLHGGHRFFAESMGKKPALWRSLQESLSFAKADALVAVSHYVGSKSKELVKFKQDFQVIYNLVDTDKFFEADREKIVDKKLVFIGTVTEKKGVRQLVQAMPKIIKKFPNTSLDIIGRDWFDPKTGESYMKYLKTFITDDIKEHIHIKGVVPHDEIPKAIESAEVCVYPSHMEAMPIAWLEALGMCKAVVASQLGPGAEAVIDKKTGLLCNPFDPNDIAQKIIYMFENPQEAQQMGSNAREDILKRFNPDKIIEQNIKFYESVL